MTEQFEKGTDNSVPDEYDRVKMVIWIERNLGTKLNYDEWDGLTDEDARQKAYADHGLDLENIHRMMWKGL